MKKLYRSSKNKIIAGVLGGVGEYFALDPVFVRLVFVIGVILALPASLFMAVAVYAVALLIIPQRPSSEMENISDAEIVNDRTRV